MADRMQIVLSNPGTGPFVQQVGRALFEAGILARFATTFVDQPDAVWRKILCCLAESLNFNLERQLQRRAITELPSHLIINKPWGEFIRTSIARLDRDRRFADFIWEWSETSFDHWVANYLSRETSAVYGYEHASLATFQAAQELAMARIYEVPAPEHDFVHSILQEEFEHYPELCTPYYKYVQNHHQRRTQRRRSEWQLADVVIANSEFTKASYATSGLDVTKVRVVPLGAPPACPDGVAGGTLEQEPTRFLWAGTFSVRKGAHYLLDAWKRLQSRSGAHLDVFGAMGLPSSLRQGLPDSVHFSSTVPRSELYALYCRADVLVFPTLCDGFGMVVTEAFANGLPVITTDRAGAADLVRHGVNGLIVPAKDIEALTEALDWCITHRQELKAMRQAALKTAASWQWSEYRRALVENLLDGLKVAGYSA